MPLTFVAFNAPQTDVVRVKAAAITEGSNPITAILKARIPPKKKAEGAKPDAKDPPVNYAVLLIKPVTLNRYLSKTEKEALDLPKDAKPGEPATFNAFTTQYVKIFGGPMNLKPGHAYEFLGGFYTTYQVEEDSEPLISLKAVQVKPLDFDVQQMFRDLPYEMRCIKTNVKPSFFAVPVEQDADARSKLQASQGDNILLAKLEIPPGGLDTNNLVRTYGDETKGQIVKNEISFTAGKTGNAYLDPMTLVFQSTTGPESGEVIPLQFYCESSAFDAFMLTVFEWELFGKALMPVATGMMFGEIDFDKTEMMPPHEKYDRIYAARAVLLLNAEEMIRRVAVPLDWEGLQSFYDPQELNSDFWPLCKVKTDKTTSILNLGNVKGDFSSLKPLVEAGTVQIYVLANWNIDADDFTALKALPMADRVGAILGNKDCMKLGYGRDEPIHLVWAIGPELLRHLQPLPIKKKVRA
jgi:hypothetical protein